MDKIIIPIPPVAKGRPRFARKGNFVKTYTPKKTLDFEKQVKIYASLHMRDKKPLECPLELRIVCHRYIPSSFSKKKTIGAINKEIYPTTRPDVDNYAKAVLDGLNGVLFKDDSQIIRLISEKYYSSTPQVEVLYAEMGV